MLESGFTAVSSLHMKRAKELLNTVPVLLDIGDYNSSVNRAYYAAFHAIKAVEALDNYDSKKHSGLMSYFRQNYIKTGIFDVEYSDILKSLVKYREDSDYNIIIVITSDEAKEQYENAKQFVTAVEEYLNEKLDEL